MAAESEVGTVSTLRLRLVWLCRRQRTLSVLAWCRAVLPSRSCSSGLQSGWRSSSSTILLCPRRLAPIKAVAPPGAFLQSRSVVMLDRYVTDLLNIDIDVFMFQQQLHNENVTAIRGEVQRAPSVLPFNVYL